MVREFGYADPRRNGFTIDPYILNEYIDCHLSSFSQWNPAQKYVNNLIYRVLQARPKITWAMRPHIGGDGILHRI
jgi:hypothetical protein